MSNSASEAMSASVMSADGMSASPVSKPDHSTACAHWAFATFIAFQLCAMLSLVSRAPLAVGLGFAAALFLFQSLALAYVGRAQFLGRFVLVAETLVLMLVVALSTR